MTSNLFAKGHKNNPGKPAPAIEPFEVRMARYEEQVKAATDEQLQIWASNRELGDLNMAAFQELRVREAPQDTKYEGLWIK